jgi:hypothetical protein
MLSTSFVKKVPRKELLYVSTRVIRKPLFWHPKTLKTQKNHNAESTIAISSGVNMLYVFITANKPVNNSSAIITLFGGNMPSRYCLILSNSVNLSQLLFIASKRLKTEPTSTVKFHQPLSKNTSGSEYSSLKGTLLAAQGLCF